VRNASSVDGRSDVWSLGVSMYELLTGRMPFDGDGVGAILAAILEADPVPVHDLRPEVPLALSDVIGRCLRRKLDDRWADVGELARALAPFGTGTWTAYPERIAATLVNARQLRAPTPLGAFAVTSLAALVVQAEVDPLGPTQPPPARPPTGADTSQLAHAPTLRETDRSAITHPGRRGSKPARWLLLGAAVPVAVAVALAASRAHDEPAAAVTPPPASPASSQILAAATSAATVIVPPLPSVSAAPGPLPVPSATAATSAHRPPHRWQLGPPAARPAILHSRN